MRNSRPRTLLSATILAGVLAALASPTAAHAAPAAPPTVGHSATTTWTEDLSQQRSDDVNIDRTATAIRVRDNTLRPAAHGGSRGFGLVMLPQHRLAGPADQVSVDT